MKHGYGVNTALQLNPMVTSAIIGHMTAAQAENDLVSVKALVNRLLEVGPVTSLATLPHEACRERCPALRSDHH